MNKTEAVRRFKEEHRGLYIDKVDYWTAHLAWASFIDALNKEGEITDRQASSWSTPFPYGKPLKPSKKQLEDTVYGKYI